jgi:hypothetical protein
MSLIELEANLDRSEIGESNRAVIRRCGSMSWERERINEVRLDLATVTQLVRQFGRHNRLRHGR